MSVVIAQVKDMARYTFQTQSEWILGVAGPGSAAMEMAIANLVDARSRVLCLVNGYFSQRMAEMAGRAGAQVLVHEAAGTQPLDLAAFEAAVAQHRPHCVPIVHGETSKTTFNANLAELAPLHRAGVGRAGPA